MEELGVADKERAYARWVRYVNAYEEGATLYEGFGEVSEALARTGVVQAVVSAKTRAQYEIDVVSKGIDAYMDAVVLAEDTERHKPTPSCRACALRAWASRRRTPSTLATRALMPRRRPTCPWTSAMPRGGSVSSEGVTPVTHTFDAPRDLLALAAS